MKWVAHACWRDVVRVSCLKAWLESDTHEETWPALPSHCINPGGLILCVCLHYTHTQMQQCWICDFWLWKHCFFKANYFEDRRNTRIRWTHLKMQLYFKWIFTQIPDVASRFQYFCEKTAKNVICWPILVSENAENYRILVIRYAGCVPNINNHGRQEWCDFHVAAFKSSSSLWGWEQTGGKTGSELSCSSCYCWWSQSQ